MCGTDVEYVGSAREEDRRFALLRDVFEAFPTIPINIDIKINDDQLISKVSDLIKQYNREEYTVWGNFSDEVTQKCYKSVCPYTNLLNFQNLTQYIFEKMWNNKKLDNNFYLAVYGKIFVFTNTCSRSHSRAN